jgi:putative CocE/NonD family hydrolase
VRRSPVRQHRLTRALFGAIFGLPRRASQRITAELDFAIPLPDGIELLADRWAPEGPTDALPTVLVRTCYSRKAFWSLVGRSLAERGFQVVIVNSRGTFGSGGGPFYPMHHEHDDGLAVLDWVRTQPWYGGSMILAGASYLGYTQWAVAADAPDDVIAMHPHITSARLAQNFTISGALELDTAARWSYFTARQELPGANTRLALGVDRRQLDRLLDTLPMNIIDSKMIGQSWPFYQDTIVRLEDDPRWHPWNRSVDLPRVRIPASFVAGWYDPFLIDQLDDFTAMQSTSTPARLTVGPWTHMAIGVSVASVRDTLEWSGIQSGRVPASDRLPVRVFVMGARQWQDFDEWPPREANATAWYLGAGGELGTDAPKADAVTEPSRYRYDPANPTPSVGGRLLLTGAGRKNNRRLEERSDVLTFTSDPLERPLRIVGEVTADVWMTSSCPTWDLFVRLCDVDARGRSHNVTDGLIRVTLEKGESAAESPARIHLRLAPTAQEFARGHRLRIQVSSGAHPRFARNLGSLDQQVEGTELFVADQAVFHDAKHPSSVTLPVLPSVRPA